MASSAFRSIPAAVEYVRGLSSSLHTTKFRMMSDVQDIHAMLDVPQSDESIAAVDRRQNLIERLADYTKRVQRIDRSIVALTRLSETHDAESLLTALQEIFAVLIGCEKFAIFTANAEHDEMTSLFHSGVTAEEMRSLSGTANDWKSAKTGSATPDLTRLPAFVPLLHRTQPVGLLLLCELLPQRTSLDLEDGELLEILSQALGELLTAFCNPEPK